jgi:hypothetical protein
MYRASRCQFRSSHADASTSQPEGSETWQTWKK